LVSKKTFMTPRRIHLRLSDNPVLLRKALFFAAMLQIGLYEAGGARPLLQFRFGFFLTDDSPWSTGHQDLCPV
jgi:hypothetical protein